MLLNSLRSVPFIQCLVYFPFETHKIALKKFLALWILTSLPVIVAAVLSPIPDGNADVWMKLASRLRESITVSELFVYTATFITPVLYMVYEKQLGNSTSQSFGKISHIKELFKGYGIVALVSSIVLLLTAVAFSQIKAGSTGFSNTFLDYYLNGFSLAIYIFSLYCWYLTLLDGTFSGDFVTTSKNSEKNLIDGFSERLRARVDKYE